MSKKSQVSQPRNARMQEKFEAWINDSITEGKMPTGEVIVSLHGNVICQYKNVSGLKRAKEDKTYIYRLYSMTKPIISVAALILLEQNLLSLSQPIYTILGDKWRKEQLRVIDHAKSQQMGIIVTKSCLHDITIHHLLTHTSGFSHGLSDVANPNAVDVEYFYKGISGGDTILLGPGQPGMQSLDEFLSRLVQVPLLFQPGEGWEYSYGMEVMGHIIELLSKTTLEQFVQDNICSPLGMKDTTFVLNKEQNDRLCPLHFAKPGGAIHPEPTHFPVYNSGCAGLFSTAQDYFQFVSMIQRKGVSAAGKRILSEDSVQRLMLENQLANNATYKDMGTFSMRGAVSQTPGFGYSYAGGILIDNMLGNMIASKGEFSWGGAAQTQFWYDGEEDIVVVFMTSILVSKDEFPVNSILHSLVYGALEHTKQFPK